MSAAAALRGSGNWVAYLNFGQPWLTAGSVMVGSAWAVAAGAVAAAAGLAGLARRDLPEAGWLRGYHGRGRPVGADRLQPDRWAARCTGRSRRC